MVQPPASYVLGRINAAESSAKSYAKNYTDERINEFSHSTQQQVITSNLTVSGNATLSGNLNVNNSIMTNNLFVSNSLEGNLIAGNIIHGLEYIYANVLITNELVSNVAIKTPYIVVTGNVHVNTLDICGNINIIGGTINGASNIIAGNIVSGNVTSILGNFGGLTVDNLDVNRRLVVSELSANNMLLRNSLTTNTVTTKKILSENTPDSLVSFSSWYNSSGYPVNPTLTYKISTNPNEAFILLNISEYTINPTQGITYPELRSVSNYLKKELFNNNQGIDLTSELVGYKINLLNAIKQGGVHYQRQNVNNLLSNGNNLVITNVDDTGLDLVLTVTTSDFNDSPPGTLNYNDIIWQGDLMFTPPAGSLTLDAFGGEILLKGNTIRIDGNLFYTGNIIELNKQTLTLETNTLVLNANISTNTPGGPTPSAGLVVEHHDSSKPKGYFLFNHEGSDKERYWDLSGDSLTGNVLEFNYGIFANDVSINNVLTGTTANFTGNVSALSLFVTDISVNTTSGTSATFINNVSAAKFVGDVSGSFANLSGNVSASQFNGNLEGSFANLSGNISALSLFVTDVSVNTTSGTSATFRNNVSAAKFVGDVSANITNGTTANFTGNVSALSLFVGDVSANIINGTNATFTGNILASLFLGDVSGSFVNLSDNVTAPQFNGNLEGTFASLTDNVYASLFVGDVSANSINGTNATFTGNISADKFLCDDYVSAPKFIGGNLLVNTIFGTFANLSGNVSASLFVGDVSANTTNGTSATFTGNVSATKFIGNVSAANIIISDGLSFNVPSSTNYTTINNEIYNIIANKKIISGDSIAIDLSNVIDNSRLDSIFSLTGFLTVTGDYTQSGISSTGVDINLSYLTNILSSTTGSLIAGYTNFKTGVTSFVDTDTGDCTIQPMSSMAEDTSVGSRFYGWVPLQGGINADDDPDQIAMLYYHELFSVGKQGGNGGVIIRVQKALDEVGDIMPYIYIANFGLYVGQGSQLDSPNQQIQFGIDSTVRNSKISGNPPKMVFRYETQLQNII